MFKIVVDGKEIFIKCDELYVYKFEDEYTNILEYSYESEEE